MDLVPVRTVEEGALHHVEVMCYCAVKFNLAVALVSQQVLLSCDTLSRKEQVQVLALLGSCPSSPANPCDLRSVRAECFLRHNRFRST